MKNSVSVYLNNTDVLASDYHTAKDRSVFLCEVLREIQTGTDLLDLIDLNSTYGNGKIQASRFLTVFHRLSKKLPDSDKITVLAVCTLLLAMQKNVLEPLNNLDATQEQKDAIFQEKVWRLKLLFSNGKKATDVSVEKDYASNHPLCVDAQKFFVDSENRSGNWVVDATIDYMNNILTENDPTSNKVSEISED